MVSPASAANSAQVHPQAWVHPTAELAAGVVVEPFALVEQGVFIGSDTVVKAGAVIRAGVRLGKRNVIGEHTLLGGAPQDLAFDQASSTGVEIGDDNVLREGVMVHRSTDSARPTTIGNKNYLMGGVHVAHDCLLQHGTVIANNVLLAGFVEVHEGAFISGGVAVHQKVRVGRQVMLGGLTKLTQDAPPFSLVEGRPGKFSGLNLVGLRRAGFPPEERMRLKNFYRTFYASPPAKALTLLHAQRKANPPVFSACVLECFNFILSAKQRAVVGHRLAHANPQPPG